MLPTTQYPIVRQARGQLRAASSDAAGSKAPSTPAAGRSKPVSALFPIADREFPSIVPARPAKRSMVRNESRRRAASDPARIEFADAPTNDADALLAWLGAHGMKLIREGDAGALESWITALPGGGWDPSLRYWTGM